MPKIPKDVAERVYEKYEITLQNPMSFEEMFTACDNGLFEFSEKHKVAYERGIVKPEDQIFWIHNLHKKLADPKEPYNAAVLNTLELISHITTGKIPVFTEKPETQVDAVEKLKKNNKAAQARAKKLRVDYITSVDALKEKLGAAERAIKQMTKSHIAEVKKLNAAIDELQKE